VARPAIREDPGYGVDVAVTTQQQADEDAEQ
jgi:hypothetical protein